MDVPYRGSVRNKRLYHNPHVNQNMLECQRQREKLDGFIKYYKN